MSQDLNNLLRNFENEVNKVIDSRTKKVKFDLGKYWNSDNNKTILYLEYDINGNANFYIEKDNTVSTPYQIMPGYTQMYLKEPDILNYRDVSQYHIIRAVYYDDTAHKTIFADVGAINISQGEIKIFGLNVPPIVGLSNNCQFVVLGSSKIDFYKYVEGG